MTLKELVGSGDTIMLATLPFIVLGVIVNLAFPSFFEVGGPSDTLRIASIVVLIPGVMVWLWSAVLILRKVPRGELITTGPFAWVKHPIYTSVALLVIPCAGFLLNTWVGALIGVVLYIASRRYAPEEEAQLAESFGPAWDEYCNTVTIPWL
ncbi:MAG: isoprenylcysteine carboxylmethyltransferase family protein [Actinomycetota bacterium]